MKAAPAMPKIIEPHSWDLSPFSLCAESVAYDAIARYSPLAPVISKRIGQHAHYFFGTFFSSGYLIRYHIEKYLYFRKKNYHLFGLYIDKISICGVKMAT